MSRPLRREYEGLLDGTVEVDTPLAELVSALQAPDQPDELDGLASAMSAFFTIGPAARPAAFAPTPAPRRGARHRKAGRSLLLRLGLVFGGASIVGGVALAAYESHSHPSPAHAPGRHSGTSSSSAVGGGGGPVVHSAAPTKGTPTPARPKASSTTANGGGANGATGGGQPAPPSHTKHGPGGKPTATGSASATGPGNSGHTKHAPHSHSPSPHKSRPSR
jgi:hypothetical protein